MRLISAEPDVARYLMCMDVSWQADGFQHTQCFFSPGENSRHQRNLASTHHPFPIKNKCMGGQEEQPGLAASNLKCMASLSQRL